MFRKIFFSCLITVCVLLFLQAGATYSSSVRIHSVMTDPVGADTGAEYVTLFNAGAAAQDLSGWDLDADQLPYFTFPSGTVIGPYATLTVYLRKDGISDGNSIYTGTSFGTTNMGNTKGMVALFRSKTHVAGTLEDYVQWGEGHQAHSVLAAQTGLFDPEVFVPLALEGTPMVFYYQDEEDTEASTQTGVLLDVPSDSADPEEVVHSAFPTLRLSYVSFNNATGVADYLGIWVEDTGTNTATGTTFHNAFIQVDSHKLSLQHLVLKSGDVIHVTLGTGVEQSLPKADHYLSWPQLSGLVATTEQVLLFSDTAQITDGVCWEKLPIPQGEVQEMQTFREIFWDGPCLESSRVFQGALLSQDLELSLEENAVRRSHAGFWHIPSNQNTSMPSTHQNTNGVPTSEQDLLLEGQQDKINTCLLDPAHVSISEFLPNPDGEDTGKEWIELHNHLSSEIVLCDLFLDDAEGGSKVFDLTGYRIPAEGYLVLPDTVSKISLGNTIDRVRLLNPSGRVLHELSYENAPSGKSYSRIEQ